MVAQLIPPGNSGGDPVGWTSEQLAVATNRVPTLNAFMGTDLTQRQEFFLGGAGTAPTLITTVSGGVYLVPGGAGQGWITPGNSAADDYKLIAAPKTESWYVSARVKNPAAVGVTAGKFIIPLGLTQTDGALWVECIQSVSATIFNLNMFSGAAPHRTALGSVATIGATTCPIGSFFNISMYMNAVTGVLSVEFSDTLADSFTGAELNDMAVGPASLIAWCDDDTLDLQVDAIFAAWVSAT